MKVVLSLTYILLILCTLVIISSGQTANVASMRGRVLDPFGNPISDVVLEFSIAGQAQPFDVRTDQQGNYKVSNLPIGEYAIAIWSRGFMTERRNINLARGSVLQLDFSLVAGYVGGAIPIEVSGIIRQQDDSPVADATVTVENAFSERLIYKAKTDNSGRYKIEVLYPGQYIVHVAKPGFAVNASAVVLLATLPRQNKALNLMLSPLKLPRFDGSYSNER